MELHNKIKIIQTIKITLEKNRDMYNIKHQFVGRTLFLNSLKFFKPFFCFHHIITWYVAFFPAEKKDVHKIVKSSKNMSFGSIMHFIFKVQSIQIFWGCSFFFFTHRGARGSYFISVWPKGWSHLGLIYFCVNPLLQICIVLLCCVKAVSPIFVSGFPPVGVGPLQDGVLLVLPQLQVLGSHWCVIVLSYYSHACRLCLRLRWSWRQRATRFFLKQF